MTKYDLPLYELFTQLRQVGLPLGIDEYQLLLRALQGGFGISDHRALAQLCKTLWIKSRDEERIVDHYFEQFAFEPFDSEPGSMASPSEHHGMKPPHTNTSIK